MACAPIVIGPEHLKKFYLTGQASFGNRGCEALVRSTVGMLREEFPDAQIFVPSTNIDLDARQWPEAADHGVEFVPAFRSPFNRYWRQLQRVGPPPLKRAGWPFPLGSSLKQNLRDADAVLSIGGDNYSLDYLIPSLLMGTDAYAMRHGTPVMLWGASVGPFEAEPHFVDFAKEHLQRMSLITVRETATERYLRDELGLTNVNLVADPAFALVPEPVELEPFWPQDAGTLEKDVLGLNISPLIERYRHGDEPQDALIAEVAAFIDAVTESMPVLLVPHVIPLDGSPKNNDAIYMDQLLGRVKRPERVHRMPTTLNAAQIKYVLSQLRFFIGARTHATIGALSSEVPTGSIAYSVKAKGINQDLFGHLRYVLETPLVTRDSLLELLNTLKADEDEIRSRLAAKIPEWRTRARLNVQGLKTLMR